MLFCAIFFKKMKAKSSSQMCASLYPTFANCVYTQNDFAQKCSGLGEIRDVDW